MTDDVIEVSNPAEFLRNENGAFEVTSPYGQIFRVTCRRGSRMNIRQIGEPHIIGNRDEMSWKVRRVDSTAA